MATREMLLEELNNLPQTLIEEIYHYVNFLKHCKSIQVAKEIALASEKSLAKDWLLPEEDEAWADL